MHVYHLPFKSVAVALLFGILLGPVGLLYATVWGGGVLIIISCILIISKLYGLLILLWLSACIMSVAATNHYNKKVLREGLLNAEKNNKT